MTSERTLALGNELLIYQVGALKAGIGELLAAMDDAPGDAPLCLSAHALVDLDGAGMQLLAVLRRECTRRGVPLQWDGLGHGVAAGIEAAGMARALGLASAEHAARPGAA